MKRILIVSILSIFLSCTNSSVKNIKGSEKQERFIQFVFRNYPLTSDNEIQKVEKNKIFNKKLQKYVYDSLQNIDGFLMKIKKINLQQFTSEKHIEVVLIDYKDHLLNIDYHAKNIITKNTADSTSILYKFFIDKKLNDYVFVYAKLDTVSTFYKGFQWENYKINIDSVLKVENPNLIKDKNEKIFH